MNNAHSADDPISRLQTIVGYSSTAIERLAQFAIERREDVPSMAIGDFAEAAGASQTTVVRLCKELGYAGYKEFRMAMAESRGTRRNADLLGLDVPIEASSADDIDVLAMQVIRINADILADTLKLIDPEAIRRAIDLMLSSTHIHLVGFGSSASLALDIYQRLLRLGIAASYDFDPHIVATIAATAPPGSLLFGVSYSGTTRDLVETLEIAKAHKLRSIVLTSFAASPAAHVADVTLLSALRSTGRPTETISSRISQLAIVDVLFVSLALRHPWKAEMVEAAERALDRKRINRSEI